MAHSISKVVGKIVSKHQRRCISGRQGPENIREQDDEQVAQSVQDPCALTIAFYFAGAVPCILYKYLLKALRHCRFPQRFIKILKLLYDNILHVWHFQGCVVKCLWGKRGIKQGCAVSGLIFCIAIDPALNFRDEKLQKK